MRYRWNCCNPDPECVERLVEELGLPSFTAGLLVNRGLSDPEEAWNFLNPGLDDLHDPHRMKNMGRTVARILQALERREKILVYGDYDVDGITSTVVLRRALEMLGGEVDYHIPRRLTDGYGLREEVIREAHQAGCRLVVSVDSGIRDIEVCECARELGLDLIITDHHLPGQELPPAYSILNPRQPECPYPDKDLAGVGVVFKLVQALFEDQGRGGVLPHFLKVVAIGTVADMVPLRGENRVIVKIGLSALSDTHNTGLQALLDGSGIGGKVDQFDIGFKLAPRINAFTRMGGGSEVVDLFSVRSRQDASEIVEEMNTKNLERRAEEDRILKEIEGLAEANPAFFSAPFILLKGDGWHRGVIGNVASRVVQKYFRPTLILSASGEFAQGSGRSIPGFHLLDALEGCREYFSKYGGHAQAVGCTVKPEFVAEESLAELRHRLQEYTESILPLEEMVPELRVDFEMPIESLNLGLCREVDRLSPFGIGNPLPLFASRSVTLAGGPWVLKEKHLKFRASANGTPVEAIWWRKGKVAKDLSRETPLDLVYSMQQDSYAGRTKVLLTVKDLRTT